MKKLWGKVNSLWCFVYVLTLFAMIYQLQLQVALSLSCKQCFGNVYVQALLVGFLLFWDFHQFNVLMFINISSCKLWFCLGCSWYLLSVILLLSEDMYIMAIYLYDHFISETERMKMMLRLYLHLVGWFWKASPSTFLESKF